MAAVMKEFVAIERADEEDELEFVDRLLESWGDWARHSGQSRLMPAAAGDVLGIVKQLEPARGILDIPEERFMRIDRALGTFTNRLRRIVFVEYLEFPDTSQEFKARHIGIVRTLYRVRLHAAKAAMYSVLKPDVDNWRREFV